jgi:hypothetical protein
VDGFGGEHQIMMLLEHSVNVAVVYIVSKRSDQHIRRTHSEFLFPGIIPVPTVCNKPIICHAADPPFECPSRLFWAMTGTAFPGLRARDVKMSFQICVSFFSY